MAINNNPTPNEVVKELKSLDSTKASISYLQSNYVPNTRTVNGKSLSSNITLTSNDIGALPNTTSIPSSLADLTQDSTHRTVTDSEKSTWNNKQNTLTAGSNIQINGNTISATDTTYTAGTGISISSNNVISSTSSITIDSSLSTTSTNPVQNKVITNSINNITNNTTKIATSGGGFIAGNATSTSGTGVSIGNGAYTMGSIAIGSNAMSSTTGIALGNSAVAGGTDGIALGNNSATGNGIAIGKNAETNGTINAIQLGAGTNNISNTLQIFNDNIYNANTHTLTVQNISLNGNNLLDVIYPIGSIYISVNSTNPSTLFGGTWEQIKDVFLLSAGDTYTAGSTGGEAEHTLSIKEMPSHTHIQNAHTHTQNAHNHTQQPHTHQYKYDNNNNSSGTYFAMRAGKEGTESTMILSTTAVNNATTATNNSTTATNQNTGGGQAHNNMPPYLAVFMWKRTA